MVNTITGKLGLIDRFHRGFAFALLVSPGLSGARTEGNGAGAHESVGKLDREARRLSGTILFTCAASATSNAPLAIMASRNLLSKRMVATLVGRGGRADFQIAPAIDCYGKT